MKRGPLLWWWATAAVVVLVLAVLAATRALPAGSGPGVGQSTAEPAQDPPALALERIPGPVPESGTPVADLEAGTAAIGPDGQEFGALPSSEDLPGHAQPQLMAPDYVAILDRDGASIAGYAKASELYATGGISGDGITVFGADGTTAVGHFVPNKGFIPLTEDPNTTPTLLRPDGIE